MPRSWIGAKPDSRPAPIRRQPSGRIPMGGRTLTRVRPARQGPERAGTDPGRLPRVGGQTGTAAAVGPMPGSTAGHGAVTERCGGGWAASASAASRRRTAWNTPRTSPDRGPVVHTPARTCFSTSCHSAGISPISAATLRMRPQDHASVAQYETADSQRRTESSSVRAPGSARDTTSTRGSDGFGSRARAPPGGQPGGVRSDRPGSTWRAGVAAPVLQPSKACSARGLASAAKDRLTGQAA